MIDYILDFTNIKNNEERFKQYYINETKVLKNLLNIMIVQSN